MSMLRSDFYTNLRIMLALTKAPLLTDTFPPTHLQNIGARILRQGMAVSAFSLLEKYIEGVFRSLMDEISQTSIPYASFPDNLKRFITVDAVDGLSNQLGFANKLDKQALADTHIPLIAAYMNTPPSYTSLGFRRRGSNVSEEDISRTFSAFEIEKAWQRLSRIASDIGASRVSLSDDYKTLAKTRHQSAHNPQGNLTTTDLITQVETAITVAICVDILATNIGEAFRQVKQMNLLKPFLDKTGRSYRFLDEQSDGTWLERRSSSPRAVKRYPNEEKAIAGASLRSTPGLIVCRDVRQVPLALM